MEGQLSEPGSPSRGAPDLGGFPRAMEIPLQPPPPVQRVMDPGSERALARRLRSLQPLVLRWAPGLQRGSRGSAKPSSDLLRPPSSYMPSWSQMSQSSGQMGGGTAVH